MNLEDKFTTVIKGKNSLGTDVNVTLTISKINDLVNINAKCVYPHDENYTYCYENLLSKERIKILTCNDEMTLDTLINVLKNSESITIDKHCCNLKFKINETDELNFGVYSKNLNWIYEMPYVDQNYISKCYKKYAFDKLIVHFILYHDKMLTTFNDNDNIKTIELDDHNISKMSDNAFKSVDSLYHLIYESIINEINMFGCAYRWTYMYEKQIRAMEIVRLSNDKSKIKIIYADDKFFELTF